MRMMPSAAADRREDLAGSCRRLNEARAVKWNMTVPGASSEKTVDNRAWSIPA